MNFRIALTGIIAFLVPTLPIFAQKTLGLEDILLSVRKQYPPLLAAWLQQDIANGKVRRAEGAFDPILSAALMTRPANYYGGVNSQVLLEQPLRDSGGSVYGGYRISSGFLADYDRKIRTADGGEGVLGFRLPLLRNRAFDDRRAAMTQAELDRELTNPAILRQYLNFIRASRVSYFNWVAAGKRLTAAEQILQVAKDRDSALGEQLKEGAIARIVKVDNRRLVVSRQIAVFNTKRSFEAASIALSLFHRDLKTGATIMPTRDQLPQGFPPLLVFDELTLVNDRGRAIFRRPEVRQIAILQAKGKVDQRLALNNLKPNLDLSVELNQALGGDLPKDIENTEITALLSFSVPIGRNEAKGRIEAVKAHLAQLAKEKEFARENIIADANDSFSALNAAYLSLGQTSLNVELSEELEDAENAKFQNGASDLLALQIREQATFDARILEVDALNSYFRALADYQAAVAKDAPTHLTPVSR
ncbi:MAG: outer membrane protein TolC [Akkermansiaceae bacterium]|jgi:outer membrane protein TolC